MVSTLEVNETDLRLKFLFDHIRNYGIASTMILAGIYLVKNQVSNFSLYELVAYGWILVFIGYVLIALNFYQLFLLMVKYKFKTIPYSLIGVVLFILINAFILSSISQKLI